VLCMREIAPGHSVLNQTLKSGAHRAAQARGHDPMYARVWESMAALAGSSPAGV
jgi:hypothetical protein